MSPFACELKTQLFAALWGNAANSSTCFPSPPLSPLPLGLPLHPSPRLSAPFWASLGRILLQWRPALAPDHLAAPLDLSSFLCSSFPSRCPSVGSPSNLQGKMMRCSGVLPGADSSSSGHENRLLHRSGFGLRGTLSCSL